LNASKAKGRILEYLPSALVFAAIVILWQVLTVALKVPSFLLPTPSAILSRLLDPSIPWIQNSLVTTYEAVAGFLLAALFGILVAMPMALSRRLAAVAYPFVIAAQVMPKLAFVPILFIWLGFNALPKVVTVFLVCFFPVVIDTVAGLSSIDPEMVDLVRLQTPSRWDLLRKAMLPNALPNIFSGLRISVTLSLIGAVVAEFVSSSMGLGFLVLSAETELNTALAFASATLLVIIGFVLYFAVDIAERYLVPWKTNAVREVMRG
jgi:NitT/TauT family transport system permease protein